MTAYTPRGYPYPDDYQQPADVPAALDALASAIDADVEAVDQSVDQVQVLAQQANDKANAVESRSVVAGSGLTGGGTLAASRTLNVGAGTGISVSGTAVAVDTNTIATRAYADGKVANNITGGSTTVAPSQASAKTYIDGRIWFGTQAQYDAIGTKDPSVLYCVAG